MILSDAAIKNRATVCMLVLLIVSGGLWSYFTLPREAAPDVPIPKIMVITTNEGVSPEDIESSITIKIENELSGLKGVKEMSSSSSEGTSTIMIEFDPGVQIEDARQYVRDRVDVAKPDLPEEADDPRLEEINVAEFPIIMLSISGDLSPVRLKVIADKLEDQIKQLSGVLDVDISGDLEREVRLEVDTDRLSVYNLTIAELLSLVPAENVNISAGGLETEGTKFNLRVPAEFTKPEDVNQLILAYRGGNPIYLSDVATVVDTFKDRLSYSRLNGLPSITLSIQKRIGADIIPISDAVKATLAEARSQVPAGVRLEVTFDQAKYIRMMVSDLENNILTGLILVVVVLMLFMGLRSSLIVALAIPMSMLMSFAVISLLGYTLNMIVLFSLVLSLGMLVDNAIVIVENIYRHMQMGFSPFQAAVKGTREVAWPVTTSTATTIAAFFPLLFWPGMMGDFMKYLPIGVIVTLSSSLFVALVISPTVCSIFGGNGAREISKHHPFLRGYRRLLEVALHHRTVSIALSLLVLIGVVALYAKLGRGIEFFPITDPDRGLINLRLPQGANIRETDRMASLVEKRVLSYLVDIGKTDEVASLVEQRLRPFLESGEIEHIVTNVGSSGDTNMGLGGTSGGPHLANITLVFPDYEDRERPSAAVIAEIRARLSDIVGAEVKVQGEEDGPPTGAPVTIRIAGRDFKMLQQLSDKVKDSIGSVPGLVNLRSDLELARPELAFHVDRSRAMLLGVNTATVGEFLKTAIFGRKVGIYRQYNDEYDITVRLPLRKRLGVADVMLLRLPNVDGESIPLSSLGEIEYRGGFGTINRISQKRVATITADAEGRLGPAVLADVKDKLADELELEPGYTITYAGEEEEMAKAEAFLSKAFLIALLCIVLILVTQFNSFQAPVIIMTTVLLSLIGVLAGLIVFGMPFGIIMTGIGVISLAGVVVNNAIVLLAYTRQLRRQGVPLLDAAVQAGETRLRPVLLTATTTILGLLPMATGVAFDFIHMKLVTNSSSSQWWSSMAIAVITGLAFATVLTLIVVPTLYVSLQRLVESLGSGEKAAEDSPPGSVG